jgi:hypothetical protein
MAQKPLSREGGEAAHLGIRITRRQLARLDREAQRRGLGRSEYVRLVLGFDDPNEVEEAS